MKHSPGQNAPPGCEIKTVNEEEISEPFARERRRVSGGH